MKLLFALTAVATIAASSAEAAPYTLFIYGSDQQLALRPGDDAASMAYWEAAVPLALGGYVQIDVPSDANAIAWAGRMPVSDGVVEVRAGYPVPGMAM